MTTPNQTADNIIPMPVSQPADDAATTNQPQPPKPVVEIDESRLKKKVWMLIGVSDAFSTLPKISTELEIVTAKEIITAARHDFESGNFQEAAFKATRGLQKLEEACDLLPKAARGLVRDQLKKIGKY